jgi:hypothetical protein
MKTFWKLIFKDIGNDSDELFVELSFSPKFIIHLGDSAYLNESYKSEFLILGRNSDN